MEYKPNSLSASIFSQRLEKSSSKQTQRNLFSPNSPKSSPSPNFIFFDDLNDSTNYLSSLIANTRCIKSSNNREKKSLLQKLSEEINSLNTLK